MFKNVRRIAAILGCVGLLAAGKAEAFSLLEPYNGPIKFKYSNYESLVTEVGQTLNGIFKITSIETDDANNTGLWFPKNVDLGYEEITGTFTGYNVANISSVPGGQAIDFTGGLLNMYLDNTPDFNANPYPTGTGVTDGILFLSLKAIPGIVTVDDPGTAWDETQDTLRSTVDQLTTPFSGKGIGLLEITGGAYAHIFGGIGSILSLDSTLRAPGPAGVTWPVVSEDPLRGNIVPEPGTFVLLGLGLAGLGLYSRKRSRN